MLHTEAPAPAVPADPGSAASNYDRLSRWYDLLSGPFESRWRDRAARQLNVTPGQTVLEIGCGTGWGLIRLAEAAGTTGRVYGVDLSAGMCRVAHSRVHESGRVTASVIRGDAQRLPLASGGFNAIFMSFTLELFSSQSAAVVLAECRRVLAPQGRLAVVALDRPARATLTSRLYDWASRRFPAWIDCHPVAVVDILRGSGFNPIELIRGAIAGLPVAIVIAETTSP